MEGHNRPGGRTRGSAPTQVGYWRGEHDMNFELAFIRVVHILVGVIWAGSAIFLAAVLDPRLRALGPDVHRRVTEALYVPVRFVLEGGRRRHHPRRNSPRNQAAAARRPVRHQLGLGHHNRPHNIRHRPRDRRICAVRDEEAARGSRGGGRGNPAVGQGNDAGAHDGAACDSGRGHHGCGEVRRLKSAESVTSPHRDFHEGPFVPKYLSSGRCLLTEFVDGPTIANCARVVWDKPQAERLPTT